MARPNIEVDGQEFESAFHAFMHQCMTEKNLTGKSQSQVQDELENCADAWERVVDRAPVGDVDEEELAEQFLSGRQGTPTGRD